MKLPAIPTTAVVFSVNVPPFIISEPNERAPKAVWFIIPPLFMVTDPVKVFVPVLAKVNVPETVVVPPTVNVQVLVAPVANVAPVLMIKGTPEFNVFAELVVIVAVLLTITPPLPPNGLGHSVAPIVLFVAVLYCSVAPLPKVTEPAAVIAIVADPSIESTPFTVGVVANVFAPEPETVRLEYVVTLAV